MDICHSCTLLQFGQHKYYFRFHPRQRTWDESRAPFRVSPTGTCSLRADETNYDIPSHCQWQREIKLVSWFSQTHSAITSASHQCCAEAASWAFREDHTISKDKPIKPNPTRSHPFPDAATDFCQDGVEKQRLAGAEMVCSALKISSKQALQLRATA